MLTIDELAAIPLFSSLEAAALKELSRTAADMHLNVGEYAVHEGDEPALYVVLEGNFEVTKLIDGINRTIGQRAVGIIFGEIPLVYGTQFQSNCHAIEPSRVLRIDARNYYVAAAATPDLAKAVGDLARERLGGLQGLATEPHQAKVTMVGPRWDASCLKLRTFLTRNQISYNWITLDAPELPEQWPGPPPTECPALRLADGTTLIQPQTRELAELLGLQTTARETEYDTIIIGGGPAGLAAAVYGASEGLRTIAIEREAPGGQAGTSSRIENYLGFPSGISGDELARRALSQARRLGAEILTTRDVASIDTKARTILLDGDELLRARTIILATGVSWRRPAIDDINRFIGKGVYFGAARSEAHITQGQDVHLIGAGNSAGQAAMFFSSHARTVTLVVRGESLEKSMSQYLIEQLHSKSNIEIALGSEVHAIHGDDHLTAIDLINRTDKSQRRVDCGGLFVFIGADAETDWLPSEIIRNERGYVLTGDDLVKAGSWKQSYDPMLLETSVAGIFACGDVRYSPVKRVASAVGEGSMAIAFVHQYLQRHETSPAKS